MITFQFCVKEALEVFPSIEGKTNFTITGVSTANNPRNNTVLFFKRVKESQILKLQQVRDCVLIVPKEQATDLAYLKNNNAVLITENPRLQYAIFLQTILNRTASQKVRQVFNHIEVGADFYCGQATHIAPNVYIGNNVHVGHRCTIMSGAVINDGVYIGDDVIIREYAVVGGYGFGFERDACGNPIRLPHIGGVVIGDFVEVGALSTIASGTIEPTVIEAYVKIDDHVHIAHNCKIGRACIITACTEISGSVEIGEKTWLGPNCSVINGIKIGSGCLIGIGAVVKKSTQNNQVVSGNPAKRMEEIRDEIELERKIKKIVVSTDIENKLK